MSQLQDHQTENAAGAALPLRLDAHGKFLRAGGRKLFARGVTYGTFRAGPDGSELYDPASVVPPGEAMVLVDQDAFGAGFAAGRRAIPFTGREGRYWGPPADGARAVAELTRLGASGVRFVVFGWPAFWWLDHYPELRAHLGERYTRVLDTGRLKVFQGPHRS